MNIPLDSGATVLRDADRHLAPGIASLHRIMGSGGVEESAQGAEVRLDTGRTVLDFGSYAVPLYGHRPARVLDAVRQSLDAVPATTRLLANPYPSSFAARLVEKLEPDRLTRVWLGLNGSDAVETALKLAIAGTGRTRLLAAERAFHGKTLGALAVTSDAVRRAPFLGLVQHASHLPLEPDAVARAAEQAPFAALIVEPVQGEGGGRFLPPALLRRWSEDAHAAGAFVIADEIQVGLRRCGPVSLAIDYGMRPDAVLFGKALGGGVMPLSAVVCTRDMFTPLIDDPFFHTTTFGGHPASCAAGLAGLALLDSMAPAAERVGRQLSDGLELLAKQHVGVVTATRSMGAFGVIEFGSSELANAALFQCGRQGLLMARCLSVPNTVRLLPPLVTTDAQLAQAMDILDTSCAKLTRGRG